MPDSRRAVDRNWCCAWKPANRSSPWARVFAVSPRTAGRWRARYRADGWAGLADRSSRPHTSPRVTAPRLQLTAKVLRRQQWTCGQIAAALELSAATVARVLRRCGLSRRGRLTAPPVAQRYEHAAVGDLLHLDPKKLGRIRGLGHRVTGQRFHRVSGAGWEYLPVAVHDHSRVASVELLPDQGQATARRFLRGHLLWFRAHRVRVRRILTDNGSAYRSRSFRAACRALRVSHRRTRPYTPRTNGKAERFIQTALRERAYRRPHHPPADPSRALPGWGAQSNCAPPHTSLYRLLPITAYPRDD